MKVFYYDTEFDDGIDSNQAIEKNLEESLNIFYDLSEEIGSFIGFKNDSNKTLQLQWVENKKLLADFPEASKKGSFQQILNYEECVNLIKLFFGNEYQKILNSFDFVTW